MSTYGQMTLYRLNPGWGITSSEFIKRSRPPSLTPFLSTRIGTFYNAAPGALNKDQVEAWASKAYPEIWAELLKIGKSVPMPANPEDYEEGEEVEEDKDEREMQRLAREQMMESNEGLFNIDRSAEA